MGDPGAEASDTCGPWLLDLPSAQDFVPRESQEILATLPTRISAEEIFHVLSREPSKERVDLVGASNIDGGSGGSLGRFFEVGSFFLKTHRSRRFSSAALGLQTEGEIEQLRRALGIYHPARVWFLSQGPDGGFWACSLAPRLPILREDFNRDPSLQAPWRFFLQGISIALKVTATAGIVLDCNPNNFGREGDQLYYVDDDLRCPPALLAQVLLRLREYPSTPESVKAQYLESFSALVTSYPIDVLKSLGLRADLESEVFWPTSSRLQEILERLRRHVL